MAENTAGRQRKGGGDPFKKGQSGNPSGRPSSARNATTLAIEKLLDGEAKEITRVCIDRAKEGDSIALRLVMERIAPVRRGARVHFDLPEIEQASDLAKALGGILKATARGALTPDEAATIAGVLDAKRRAIETGEMEKRLEQLEQRLVAGGSR